MRPGEATSCAAVAALAPAEGGGAAALTAGRSERSLLATLPEATFVRRYRESFAS